MRITAYTPRGRFDSIDEPIPPLDRAAVQSNLTKQVAEAKVIRLSTTDGFIIIPGEMVAQSVFVIENFNTPEPEAKL